MATRKKVPTKGAKKKVASKRAAKKVGATGVKARVRMYRQGLGDCFLVTFFTASQPVHMLIDCGTLGSTTTGVKLADVTQNIFETTGGHLDILVATHEHKDHVSGFGGTPSPYDRFKVDRVFVAWTEDPSDELAKKIAKYKGDLREAVALVSNAIVATQLSDKADQNYLGGIRNGMREILSFFDDIPDGGQLLGATLGAGVDAAMRYVTNRAQTNVDFLIPGSTVDDAVPGVRFYILGPPQSESALRNMGDHGSPELYSLASQLTSDLTACSRFSLAGNSLDEYRAGLDPVERQEFEARLPFDPRFRVESTDEEKCKDRFGGYYEPGNAWRRIDSDWLSGGSELALQLDSYTNNTSLAMAIEFIDDKRVLLFPADAQVGNWLSWHEHTWKVTDDGKTRDVNAADLLARTVFYKVGHHSSHNATVREHGLELMDREDLVAMIPVDRKVALKKKWQMPAAALYQRLVERTMGRVVRSDTGWPEDRDRPASISKAEWAAARAGAPVTENDMFFDYELR